MLDILKQIRVLNCDTEILKDFFSFGFKIYGPKRKELKISQNLKYYGDNEYIFECYNNQDCIDFSNFYNTYLKNNTVQLFYNASFDKAMLDILLHCVKINNKNILKTMRSISSCICKDGLNYFKFKESLMKKEPRKESEKKIRDILKPIESSLIENDLLKPFFISDVPTIAGNVFIQDEKLRPSTGLKKSQLIFYNRKLTFDFSKYETIEQIKKDNLMNEFTEYSLFDLKSLETFVNMFCLNVFENRKKVMSTFNIKIIKNYKMIFSENSTYLINYLYKIRENEMKRGEKNG